MQSFVTEAHIHVLYFVKKLSTLIISAYNTILQILERKAPTTQVMLK